MRGEPLLINIGQKFGRWTVLSFAGQDIRRNYLWSCVCDCGNTRDVKASVLGLGRSKSCGCLNRDRIKIANRTHGDTTSGLHATEYTCWQQMIHRCKNKTSKMWRNYGGRGISVCQRWLESYEHFLSDMGRKPSQSHSLDRIDNSGNYEPSNCRWATPLQQSRNSRACILKAEQIPVIRKQISDGMLQRDIADLYGVGRGAISMISQGKNWNDC